MDLIRNWILSVTVCAMIIALAEGMMPDGTVKKIAKLTGGLVLMLGILQPIVHLDYDELFQAANGLPEVEVTIPTAGEDTNTVLIKSIIEEKLSAYVWDKAQALGIACVVQIRCTVNEEAVPVPEEAEVRGLLSAEQQRQMEHLLVQELGIAKEEQTYINEEVT